MAETSETPMPAPEVKPIQPAKPEAPGPVSPEAKEGEGFASFLETLGMIVDTNVVLDEMQGKKRDVGDIMKDVLASAEQKLAAAKAAQEGKK